MPTRHPDVVWRDASDTVYLLAPDRRSLYRVAGAQLIPVTQDEATRIFGSSDEAVIRISNQI